MNIEQVIELVEKWLEDNSSVTVEELDAAAAFAAAANTADWAAVYAITWAAAYDAANAAWAAATWADADQTAWAAKHVAKYRELTKQGGRDER